MPQNHLWGLYLYAIDISLSSLPWYDKAKRDATSRIFESPCALLDVGFVTGVYNSAINFTLPQGRGYRFKHLQHPDSYMHGCWSECGYFFLSKSKIYCSILLETSKNKTSQALSWCGLQPWRKCLVCRTSPYISYTVYTKRLHAGQCR